MDTEPDARRIYVFVGPECETCQPGILSGLILGQGVTLYVVDGRGQTERTHDIDTDKVLVSSAVLNSFIQV